MAHTSAPRLVILDDHITPYRVPIFTQLHRLSVDLRVLYCKARLPDRLWELPAQMPYPHEILPGGVIRLRRAPYGEPRQVLVNPTLLFRLIRIRPEVVVGYAYSLPTWTAFAYAKVSGARFISWCTDTLHTERYLGWLQKRIRRLIVPKASACITASKAGTERFVYWGASPERIRVVPQGPDADALQREISSLRQSGRVGVDNRGPVLLYVGSLSERKGVELLLDAFRHVHADLPEARLQFVGEGPLRESLAHKIESWGLGPAVEMAGFVPHGELPLWYARASAFVLPTLEDTYGVALAEAAACGLPLIATPFAGAAGAVLQEGRNGILVDPREPSLAGREIARLLSDKQALTRMGRESLTIARGLGPNVAATQILEAVRLALASPRGVPGSRVPDL